MYKITAEYDDNDGLYGEPVIVKTAEEIQEVKNRIRENIAEGASVTVKVEKI